MEARACKLEGSKWKLYDDVKIIKDEFNRYQLDFGTKEDKSPYNFQSDVASKLFGSGNKGKDKLSSGHEFNDFDDDGDRIEEEVVYVYEYVDEGGSIYPICQKVQNHSHFFFLPNIAPISVFGLTDGATRIFHYSSLLFSPGISHLMVEESLSVKESECTWRKKK